MIYDLKLKCEHHGLHHEHHELFLMVFTNTNFMKREITFHFFCLYANSVLSEFLGIAKCTLKFSDLFVKT